MMTKHLFPAVMAVVLTALLTAGNASAAELGRVVIDGRTLIINDDNSWEYASEEPATAAAECVTIESEIVPLSVCLDPGKWVRADLGADREHQFQRKGKDQAFLIIPEKEVLDFATLKKAILINAQTAAGLSKVETLEELTLLANGHQFNKIKYKTNLDGDEFTYTNYYTSFENRGSVQLIFYGLTEGYEEFESVIDEVAASLAVTN